MIHINFTEPVTEEWQRWCSDCELEQASHNTKIQSGQNSEVKSSIYKGQKHVYIDPDGPFHGKCAYCESEIYSNQFGDIEHFRPKAGLKDYPTGQSVKIEINGISQDHPGYYWLAYDWKNLLLSCVLCNRLSSGHSSHQIGKGNYFPVNGSHAINPGDEVNEDPLLIHPVFENPEDHLKVDESGIFYSKNGSLRGETCIRIFGLNDRGLPNERKATYKKVSDRIILVLMERLTNRDTNSELPDDIKRIDEGFEAFTAAARKAILHCKELCERLWPE